MKRVALEAIWKGLVPEQFSLEAIIEGYNILMVLFSSQMKCMQHSPLLRVDFQNGFAAE